VKTIAVCFSLPGLEISMSDPKLGKRYPGAGWIPHLVRIGKEQGMDVFSGEQAIRYVQAGMLDPTQILVVQEEMNPAGVALINMGAMPSVLTCLESPIFAPRFYDQVESVKGHFKASILFSGGTHQLYFPSFDDSDVIEPTPWESREHLCMVVSNKHYSGMQGYYADSPSFNRALASQLHDYRYQAISHFMPRGGFTLWGKNWGVAASACDDKLQTLRGYRFNLCFENGSYPGYVTEKIIDALVAGVIPVYRGAQEIHRFVPATCYIAAEVFDDFTQMDSYLRDYSPEMASYKLGEMRAFLSSQEGQRHNNRVWAERLMEMIA
jgi:hypothetical protein